MNLCIPILVASIALQTGIPAPALQAVDPKDSATIPRMELKVFQPLQAAAKVLVLDVREPHTVEAGRIPGSVNVPPGDVTKRIAEIKTKAAGRPIVAYCACQGEHTAAEVLLVMYNEGLKDVHALAGGWSGWVKAGGKVER